MSSETKNFDPRVLGSITSGILLIDDFSKVHEAIEWVIGHPVWTHELPKLGEKAASLVKLQHPDLPLGEVAAWQATADFLLAKHGPSIPLERGSEVRTSNPVSTLAEVLRP